MVSNAVQPRFEIIFSKWKRVWKVRLLSISGEVLAESRPYVSYESALKGCVAIKGAALDANFPGIPR